MVGRTDAIAVGVSDQPGGTVALCWAAREAALRSRPLRLVHAHTDWHLSLLAGSALVTGECMIPATPTPLVRFAVQLVRTMEPAVDVTTCVRPGSLAQLLAAESDRLDIVVVGNHGAGVLDDLAGGTVSAKLATKAACPVVVVNGRPVWPDAPVVAGITDEETARAVVEFGRDVAARRAVPLTVLDVRHGKADPVTTLTDAVADAQLLVIGAPTHGPVFGRFTGSVGHALLRKPPCPTAAVPVHWSRTAA